MIQSNEEPDPVAEFDPADNIDALPARMLNEFVYCPRLFYLEHVDGLFAHNRDTIEGSIRHKRVDKKTDALKPAGKKTKRKDDDGDDEAESPTTVKEPIHARSVTLSSERYGVLAKIDLVQADGNRATPVDYKRGSPKQLPDGSLGAWDPERVQLCAQALVLRENGYQCDEGVLFFWETRQRVSIAIDEPLVAMTAGYFLAHNATRPVQKIIATTRSLNPVQLDSRLEIRGTGDELDQISSEINSFVDQISKYIKSQREFVADAAHELRTPIAAITTSVEVTLGRPRTIAEYQEELETVSEECQQLRHLVNQLLELAETDASNPTTSLYDVNVTTLIEKSVNIFSGVAEEKQISVIASLEPDVEIHSDETRLRQIVNNLLDNALKFSTPGGTIEVELYRTTSDVIFKVRDSGSGVPEEFLERIFERFFQLDPSRVRERRGGNGLGLSICRSCTQHLGGRIQATNDEQGLIIEVRFPR